MRAIVQRVVWARVSVDGVVVGRLGEPPVAGSTAGPGLHDAPTAVPGPGLCVLVGVTHSDGAAQAASLAAKLWNLRIFADAAGRMNRSAAETGAGLLVVSQFTLYGDVSRGRRPSWVSAAPAELAEPFVEAVVVGLARLGARVATGRFGAHMVLELANDGPVTIVVDV